MDWYGWRPYVPVAARRARAIAEMERLRRKKVRVRPVRIDGRRIARTFWGEAWCEHLESFSDFGNRLPRGRTYVRNGSVCHLEIAKGKVKAIVSGSALYNVHVSIKTLGTKGWAGLKKRCTGQIGSLLELLQGRLSDKVMAVVTDRKKGLFPLPKEIQFDCDCPDWASMCKHVAAVLYGVGARLDEAPELLFRLRGVDHTELVPEDAGRSIAARAPSIGRRTVDDDRLSSVFGIDLDTTGPSKMTLGASRRGRTGARAAGRKAAEVRGSAARRADERISRRQPSRRTARRSSAKGDAGAGPARRTTRKPRRRAGAKARSTTGR